MDLPPKGLVITKPANVKDRARVYADGIAGTTYPPSLAPTITGTPALPLTYFVADGSLPPGLTINSANGQISGIPLTLGVFPFALGATDVNGCTAISFPDSSITINCSAFAVTAPPGCSLAPGFTDVIYPSQTIMTNLLGEQPYTYTVTGGILPPGLNLTANGVIQGTPTAGGIYPFTVIVTDNADCQAFQNYSITVSCPNITFKTPSPLPTGVTTAPYSEQIVVTGNTTPVTYALTGGSLPPGLFLSTSGLISGTPSVEGHSSFQITVTDADGCTAFMSYELDINCAGITITPPAPYPHGFIGISYGPTPAVAVSGGQPPYTFTLLTPGTLPPGLFMEPD